MPHLAAHLVEHSPTIGLYRSFTQPDEAVTSKVYAEPLLATLEEIYKSAFWRSKARFAELRRQLRTTLALKCNWDTYGAEPPNEVARALAGKILDALETDLLLPTRLMASAEGGIAISFVEEDKRAEIEIYNTGEIAVATYHAHREPEAWESSDADSALKNAIIKIRVHLTA